jgi:plasmid replication initiation protein
VTKDNALINAAYALTLGEKRVLMMAISEIDPQSRAYLEKLVKVTLRASAFADLYGINHKLAYGELRKASYRLYYRTLRLHGDQVNGEEIRWISGQQYSESKDRVTLTFSGDIVLHLTGLVSSFTQYGLLGVAGLRSSHSARVYELCSQYKHTGWRQMSVADLRRATDTEHGYPRFADFRRRVIEQACREITRKSDLDVSWEPIREGRRIASVRFKIRPKNQGDLWH